MATKASAGRCPRCLEALRRDDVQRYGVLHSRAQSRGGPFYTMACSSCRTHLVAEADPEGGFVFAGVPELRRRPRLLEVLQFFLGPPAPESTRGRSPRQSPAAPSGAARFRSTPRSSRPATPAPGATPSPLIRRTAAQIASLARLGLAPDAALSEIKRSYRDFVKHHHPDLHRERPETEQRGIERRFVEVTGDYQGLIGSLARVASRRRR